MVGGVWDLDAELSRIDGSELESVFVELVNLVWAGKYAENGRRIEGLVDVG